MSGRRFLLGFLVVSCALAGGLALGGVPARAEVVHKYLSQITEVPASSGVPLPGPLSSARMMTIDSGHLWVEESLEGSGVDYRVRVSVRGNRFLTSVNGQLISSWMDNRISRGGVGFFSEAGEASMLRWVSVSERDSFLARIASHFSLITFPAPGFGAQRAFGARFARLPSGIAGIP